MTRRREFSRRTKLDAFEQSGGCCESCRRKLYPGDRIEYDHRVTCEQGGDNSLANCQVLCGGCHALKTKIDAKVTAKSRAVRAAHVGAKTPRHRLPGGKGSRWKAKIGGGWEERE